MALFTVGKKVAKAERQDVSGTALIVSLCDFRLLLLLLLVVVNAMANLLCALPVLSGRALFLLMLVLVRNLLWLVQPRDQRKTPDSVSRTRGVSSGNSMGTDMGCAL